MSTNKLFFLFLLLLLLISIIRTKAEASDNIPENSIIKDGEMKGFYFHEQITYDEKKEDRTYMYFEVWRSMPKRHYLRMEDLYAWKGKLHKLQVYKLFIGVETYISPEAAKKRIEYKSSNPPPGDIKAKWSKGSYGGIIFGDLSFFVPLREKVSDYKGIMFVKGNKLVEIFTFGIVDNKVLDEKFIEDVAEKVSRRIDVERSVK